HISTTDISVNRRSLPLFVCILTKRSVCESIRKRACFASSLARILAPACLCSVQVCSFNVPYFMQAILRNVYPVHLLYVACEKVKVPELILFSNSVAVTSAPRNGHLRRAYASVLLDVAFMAV
ncbi:hypothetical protein Tcan_01002, partial [Toxocara canis]